MNLNATIEIEPDEIMNAVINRIEQETGGKVDAATFKFNISRQTVGFGVAESEEWYFKNCTAKITGINAKDN